MSGLKSPSQVSQKLWTYEGFRGLDSSRDVTAQDTGSEQRLWELVNASCDFRGQIVRDGGARYIDGHLPVTHVAFFSADGKVFAEADDSGTYLRSSIGHTLSEAYPVGANVASAVFNRFVHFASRGGRMLYYDGASFHQNRSVSMSVLRPSYLATVQRRLVAAGIPGRETEVHISRVDQPFTFPEDEKPGDENVLRAGTIDVANVIGGVGRVTGIGPYEQTRLVVFTDDRALIYELDPEIDKWQIDSTANIHVGCVSHSTIQSAGQDLLFCSRRGVHSMRRSKQNGILLTSYTLSDTVNLLYRRLLESVEDRSTISAVYDQDRSQYHIFFPQPGGALSTRLTLTIMPETEEGAPPTFSTGDFLNARCGAFLNGELVFGTSGGIYEILPCEHGADLTPDARIVTPYLWHGSLTEEKSTRSLVIHASGRGVIEIEAVDLNGRLLGSQVVEIDTESDDSDHTSVPLTQQYERPWRCRYLAASYRLKIVRSSGLVRIVGMAVSTSKG